MMALAMPPPAGFAGTLPRNSGRGEQVAPYCPLSRCCGGGWLSEAKPGGGS
jgi:hypothetical protein